MSIGKKNATIKISSRALHHLLAGEIDSNDFLVRHWPKRKPPYEPGCKNPFSLALDEQMTIDSVKIDARSDEDDDWLVFELSGPDAAVAPFRTPSEQVVPDTASSPDEDDTGAPDIPK